MLGRINLVLAFNPETPLDTQLFLPELFHVVTLLLGAGPSLMRQTIYGLFVNVIQSLASTPTSGEMDGLALQQLLKRAQSAGTLDAFGLVQSSDSIDLTGGPQKAEVDVGMLGHLEEVTKLLGEVLNSGAVSTGTSKYDSTSLTKRLCKRLASSLDGSSHRHMLSAQSCDPATSLYSPRLPCVRRG